MTLRVSVRGLDAPIAAIRRAAGVVRDGRTLLSAAGKLYHDEIVPETWASNGGAIGENWKATVDGRRAFQTPNESLKQTISWVIEGARLLIGSPLKYAKTHQQQWAGGSFDGVIRAKSFPNLRFKVAGRWAQKKEVRIPQRIFLKLPLPVLQRIGELWASIARTALRGAA